MVVKQNRFNPSINFWNTLKRADSAVYMILANVLWTIPRTITTWQSGEVLMNLTEDAFQTIQPLR